MPEMLKQMGWAICPEVARARPRWQYIVGLYNAKSVSPLTDWPDGYAAWVPRDLAELEGAMVQAMTSGARDGR